MSQQPLLPSSGSAKISLPEETQYAANGVVSRAVLNTDSQRVILFGFAEAQELSEHTTPHEALVQVLSGECAFGVNDQTHQLRAGDLLYMSAGTPHWVKATSQFSMLLTLSKTGAAKPQTD